MHVRIAAEAAPILPNKDEYARRGLATARRPFLSRASFGGASHLHGSQRWSFQPYLGFGYVFPSTSVTGSVNQTVTNGLPYVQAGVDTSYSLNHFADFVFGPRFYTELLGGKMSFMANINAGVNFKF